MKSRKWLQLLLIALLIAVFCLYRQYDFMYTDTEIPQIEIDESQLFEISVQDPKSILLQGVTARDSRDGELTQKVVVEGIHLLDDDGLVEVDYAVADNSGNVAKVARKVLYTDYESPRFSLNQPLVFEEHEEFDIMNCISAVDVFDGDIQYRIRATALTEESIDSVGSHEVYFQVSNSVGDISELVVPVQILEDDLYAAKLTLTDYLIYLPVGEKFQPKAYLDSFSYRGEETALRYVMPSGFSLSITGTVKTRTPGVYVVTYKVSHAAPDAAVGQKITGYSRLIVVVEG